MGAVGPMINGGGGAPNVGGGMDLGNGVLGQGLGNGKAIGGLFGTAGGAGGSGFNAPSTANIQSGATAEQVAAAQGGVDQSLGSQQALLQALQGQNGLGQQNVAGNQQINLAGQLRANNGAGQQMNALKQSQGLANQLGGLGGTQNSAAAMKGQTGLNAQLTGANGVGAQVGALGQQGNYNQQLASANGIGTQQSAIQGLRGVSNQQQALAQQQQGLVGQYQDIAAGRGANPAQAMLNQATGQNVANQAAGCFAGNRCSTAGDRIDHRSTGRYSAGYRRFRHNASGNATVWHQRPGPARRSLIRTAAGRHKCSAASCDAADWRTAGAAKCCRRSSSEYGRQSTRSQCGANRPSEYSRWTANSRDGNYHTSQLS